MNFDEAIKAHADWKMKLRNYIAKPGGSLDANVVGADNNCALGKWLHGEGKVHAHTTEYKSLIEEHAKFHRAAANVIQKAKGGQNVTEEIALGSASEFGSTSQHVVTLIMNMKTKIGGKV